MPAQRDLRRGYEILQVHVHGQGRRVRQQEFLFQRRRRSQKDRLLAPLKEKILTLGTAACLPHHLAIVIGGTSAGFA
jgi:fumarate hydratase class I